MIKILLIEHQDIIRLGIQNFLKQDKDLHVVAHAKTAAEALFKLKEGLIADVALLGLQIGNDCGIELTQTLKAQFPNLKVLVLSQDNDDRHLSRALRAGAMGYISNDSDLDELTYGLHKVSQNKHFISSNLVGGLCRSLASRQPERVNYDFDNFNLSGREMEVLHLIANGYTNQEIGNQLFASKRTIEGHRQSLLSKTGTRNTAELIRFTTLNGLLNMAEAIPA